MNLLRLAGMFLVASGMMPVAQAQEPAPRIFLDEPVGSGGQDGAIAWGGGGRWLLISGSSEMPRVRIIDIASGKAIAQIAHPAGKLILLAAADPLHDRVAVTAQDGDTGVVDIRTEKAQANWTLPLLTSNKSSRTVSALRFTADGARLEAITTVTTARVYRMPTTEATLYSWEIATGKLIESRTMPIGVSQFSTDGKWLFGLHMTGTFHFSLLPVFVDRESAQPLNSASDASIVAAHAGVHRALVNPVAFQQFKKARGGQSPIMWGSEVNSLQLIDVTTGKQIEFDSKGATSGVFTPDGHKLVLRGAFDWRIVDALTGKTLYSGKQNRRTGVLAIRPNGEEFAVEILERDAPGLYRVSLQDPEHCQRIGESLSSPVTAAVRPAPSSPHDPTEVAYAGIAAAFTGDGRWLIARSMESRLEFFDTATGNKIPFRIPTASGSQQPLSMADNGRYLYLKSEVTKQQVALQADYKTRGAFYRTKHQIVQQQVTQGTFSTQEVDTVSGAVVNTGRFQNVRCMSSGGGFAVEYTTDQKAKASAVLKDASGDSMGELLGMGLNLDAGCSIRSDGKIVALAAGAPKNNQFRTSGDDNRDELYCTRFYCQKAEISLYDVKAHRATATLQDGQHKTVKMPFAASSLQWSSDGRFLFAGGGDRTIQHGPIRVWDAATGAQLHEMPASETLVPVGLSPDGSAVLTTQNYFAALPSTTYGVELRDADSGKILYSLGDAWAAQGGLVFSPNGSSIIGPDRERNIAIWNRADGTPRGRLKLLPNGEWLVYTPEGLFDGSPMGWSLISWRDSTERLQTSAGEIYFNEFYRPGLLADLLEGRALPVRRSLPKIDRRQPAVLITAAAGPKNTAEISIRVAEAAANAANSQGSGARDLRLFRNGLLVKVWRGPLTLGPDGAANLSVTLPLTGGVNRFSAYAFNNDNIRSPVMSASLTAPGAPGRGIAWLVAVGINEYSNPQFNLRYAVPDAEDLVREVVRAQRPLLQFSDIRSVTLRDREATRGNILLALSRLAGQGGELPPGAPATLESLAAVRPEDTVIFYFAGHGAAHGDRFYLIPHDLGYDGPRAEVRAHIERILERGISDEDLQEALEPIDARHMFVIIDACQSGQVLESDDDRRGPMNSRGLAQLAWDKGISVLAASQAYQSAVESDEHGHGYLTFALVEEGLKTPAADAAPMDRRITENEWLEYAVRRVPQLQIEAMEHAREAGRDLKIELVPKGAAGSRVQSPRLFTRRDAPEKPLTMAEFPDVH